jgi:hypothetical protein
MVFVLIIPDDAQNEKVPSWFFTSNTLGFEVLANFLVILFTP